MARPTKQVVDYFPHYCTHKKTMFIIEQHFGNDGYAAWFKILELLGKSEGHIYDCNNPDDWEFLLAKTRLMDAVMIQILDKLAKLGAIDRELWEQKKLIWSDNFVDNLRDAYKRRKVVIPQKPSLCEQEPSLCIHKPDEAPITDNINPQKKGEEKKLKESKGEEVTASVFQLFQNEIGVVSSIIAEKIEDDINEYSAVWVKEAIKIAVLRGKRNLGYAESILSDWKAKGFDKDQKPWNDEKRASREGNGNAGNRQSAGTASGSIGGASDPSRIRKAGD